MSNLRSTRQKSPCASSPTFACAAAAIARASRPGGRLSLTMSVSSARTRTHPRCSGARQGSWRRLTPFSCGLLMLDENRAELCHVFRRQLNLLDHIRQELAPHAFERVLEESVRRSSQRRPRRCAGRYRKLDPTAVAVRCFFSTRRRSSVLVVVGAQPCASPASSYTSRAEQLFRRHTIFITFHSATVKGSGFSRDINPVLIGYGASRTTTNIATGDDLSTK